MPVRTRVIVALCCLALGTPVAAQDTTAVSIAPPSGDSTSWSAGRAEGHASANEALVAHRALIGFVVGLPMGFSLIPTAVTFNPVFLAGEGVAVATVVGVARVGNANPPVTLLEQAAARGPDYERGLREGYSERLRSRRARAVVNGTAVGVATGVGLLLWAVTHIVD
jgi:hypothetical protein